MAPLFKFLNGASEGQWDQPNCSSVRDSNFGPGLLVDDSVGQKCRSPTSSMQTKPSYKSSNTLSSGDILTAVRQLQENDARKTDEIEWLRRRLDSLTKYVSRKQHVDRHSWEPEEIGAHYISPLAKFANTGNTGINTWSNDTYSSSPCCSGSKEADTHSLAGSAYPNFDFTSTKPLNTFEDLAYPAFPTSSIIPFSHAELSDAEAKCSTTPSMPNHNLALAEIKPPSSSYHIHPSTLGLPCTITNDPYSSLDATYSVQTSLESDLILTDPSCNSSFTQLLPT